MSRRAATRSVRATRSSRTRTASADAAAGPRSTLSTTSGVVSPRIPSARAAARRRTASTSSGSTSASRTSIGRTASSRVAAKSVQAVTSRTRTSRSTRIGSSGPPRSASTTGPTNGSARDAAPLDAMACRFVVCSRTTSRPARPPTSASRSATLRSRIRAAASSAAGPSRPSTRRRRRVSNWRKRDREGGGGGEAGRPPTTSPRAPAMPRTTSVRAASSMPPRSTV
jgi:hypothetical protein